ncbi:SIP domain-containing protein [Leucobacter komagatae]|uniref:Siderophore-interacting protein n=1 Tax=Leucobacter komagatae TaxID=55969 RepID=A0A0D0IKJ6_9MICO|nr:SIP domain-containing protein [Leucobacter komagatae]KIP51617.1 siderophore-interacting protein [Leucobacter komagatae]
MTTIRHRIRELSQRSRLPISATATVTAVRALSPSYTRVTVVAPEFADYKPTLPADGIKVALPGSDGAPELRAMTVSHRPAPDTIEFDALRHEGGILSPWLATVQPGERIEVHAVRREHAIGDGVTAHLIVADASALPAAASIVRAIPSEHRVYALLHAPTTADAAALIPEHPGLEVSLRTGEAWDAGELRSELVELLARIPGGRAGSGSAGVGSGAGSVSWVGADAGAGAGAGIGAGALQSWVAAEAAVTASARRAIAAHGHHRDNLFAAAYWSASSDSTARDERIRAAFGRAIQLQADLADPETRAAVEAEADTV